MLLDIPLPTGRVPRVIGVDDFALRRRHRYATVIIDAETVSGSTCCPTARPTPSRHGCAGIRSIEVVCRDGSATYAEAIRRALPDAVQVSDRWHLWHNLCDKALAEVRAHSHLLGRRSERTRPAGSASRPPWNAGTRSTICSTKGVGLLECARRLQLSP